jgi:hypothetical protein
LLSPQRPCPSSPSSPFSRTLTHQTHFADFRYLTLRQILQKPHPARTHNDLRFLADFIRNAPALKDLLEATGN